MRWFSNLPIRQKLVLTIMLVSGVVVLLGGAIAVGYQIVFSRRAMLRDLTTQAEIIGANSAAALAFEDPKAADEILRALAARPEIVFACLYTPDGKPFATYADPHARETFTSPPAPTGPGQRFEGNSLVLFRTVKLGDDVVGSICMRADLRGLRTLLMVNAAIAAAIGLLLLVIGWLLSTRLQRVISDPILQLAGLARRVTAQQDYSLRAAKHGHDEIGMLVDGFNQMLERIAERDAALRRAFFDLESSEERFRQLAETIEEVFWMTDPEKKEMIYVSPGYEAIWGRTCQSLYHSPGSWLEAIHPEDRERVRAALPLQITGEYDQVYRVVRLPDNKVRWIRDRAFPVHNAAGEIYRVAGIAEDITEYKLTQRRVEEAEAKYRTLVEQVPAIIYAAEIGPETPWYFVSPQIVNVLGFSVEEWLADPRLWQRQIHPEDRALANAADEECKQTGHYQAEYRVFARDGQVRWMRDEGLVVRDAAGQPLFLQGVLLDISDRKRLEEQVLAVSEREQTRIGQDLHDGLCQHLVGTAFTVTTLENALKERGLPQAAVATEIGRLIDEAITQARTLARGLYPVGLETGGLSFALEHLAGTISRIFGVGCRLECPRAVNLKNGTTATHMYRIAQEAVNNAIKHSQATDVIIGLHTANGHLTLSVEDNGVGITSAQQRRSGMGIHIMHYRARTIGAALEIGTRTKGGTVVRCTCSAPPPS